MATTAKKATKPIFKTPRPYTETNWPTLTAVQKRDITALVCSLVQPLGDHRRTHIPPSKGKKRKREPQKESNNDADSSVPDTRPPPPEIGNHILIGLNSVTRHLESLAAQTTPPSALSRTKADASLQDASPPRPLTMVLIPHNHPPASLPHAHIPTLVHLSNMDSQTEKATRLLAVPPGCEPAIAEALHIPHVGALGILEGAPGADALVAYVRENVDLTRCAWIDEAMGPEWKGTKMNTQPT
ncbi:hypothetical protein P171DRAFT_428423 [Karstenula rhodostoma CBS 690.94]|uniref:Rna-processing protein n=1 Tax=Karstenula rhodostoma CBS 690.94 TaxID=1392251 RepID=A0A9P4UGA9_9PLEO|nr:hypothetical protein P171DRAFT_428423 [Karstenula rhodostoma CBS 690.94]